MKILVSYWCKSLYGERSSHKIWVEWEMYARHDSEFIKDGHTTKILSIYQPSGFFWIIKNVIDSDDNQGLCGYTWLVLPGIHNLLFIHILYQKVSQTLSTGKLFIWLVSLNVMLDQKVSCLQVSGNFRAPPANDQIGFHLAYNWAWVVNWMLLGNL